MKIGKAAIIGTCLIVPGGFVALSVLACFDPTVRKKLIDIKDKSVNLIQDQFNRSGKD